MIILPVAANTLNMLNCCQVLGESGAFSRRLRTGAVAARGMLARFVRRHAVDAPGKCHASIP